MKLLLPAIMSGVLTLVALAPAATAQEAQEAQEAQAKVKASATEVERDGEQYVRVDVMIEDVEDLGGFEFVMSWDGHLLEAGDENAIERGDFLGSTGRQVYCDAPVLEPYALRYACVTLGQEPREGASGDGVLASVYLRPEGDGNSSIQFTHAQLSTPPGERIAAEWESGEVAVSSGGSDNGLWIAIGIGAAVVSAVVVAVGGGLLLYRRRRPDQQFAG